MKQNSLHVDIRTEQTDDQAAIHAVHREAFGRENEARLVDLLRRSDDFDDQLSLVALCEQQIVGHILFTPIVIRGSTAVTSALALAPMAVRPPWWNQSIGSRLVRAGLAACRRRGATCVVVVGHASYYPRFGFEPARARGLELPFPAPDEAFMVYQLAPGALNGVTGLIEYPAAFQEV